MVRCFLNGKAYETGRPVVDEEENRLTENSAGESMGGGRSVICMNGEWFTKTIESHFDELRPRLKIVTIESHFDESGRPRLKIVYVDRGEYYCDNHYKAQRAWDIKKKMVEAEMKKEEREGIAVPRLIFVIQDKDYWPGSENDPEAMIRRALKAPSYAFHDRSDFKEVHVPLTKEELVELSDVRANRFLGLRFMTKFDPYKPGTKFILDNTSLSIRDEVLETYRADPDLWRQWEEHVQQEDWSHISQLLCDISDSTPITSLVPNERNRDTPSPVMEVEVEDEEADEMKWKWKRPRLDPTLSRSSFF